MAFVSQRPPGARQHTSVHWQRFSVPYAYPVHFTERLFDPANPVLVETLSRLEPTRRHRCLVFMDEGLMAARGDLADQIGAYARQHAQRMELVAAPIAVPGGERIKNDLYFVEQMQQALYEHHIDRHSYTIVMGGGAVLDAVGLVAATTHRGVRHIRVPTTVLAQCDSGVGVKNGVNLFGQKNFVGSFAPPFAVLNDIDLIESLGSEQHVTVTLPNSSLVVRLTTATQLERGATLRLAVAPEHLQLFDAKTGRRIGR